MYVSPDTVNEYLSRKEKEGAQSWSTSFVLTDNDSAWNPASTKHRVYGPGRITYTRYSDGATEALLTD